MDGFHDFVTAEWQQVFNTAAPAADYEHIGD